MLALRTIGLFNVAFASTSETNELGWYYSFPYGQNSTCECHTVPALGTDYFESEIECMKAFAEDQYQWCSYEGVGISDSQCDDVVAIAEGVTNDLCSSKCTSLVAGSLSLEEFEETCKFNFYADFGDEVAVGWKSCFSNLVYGWSDYDPSNSVQVAPLQIFSNVEGAVQCQALCQAVDDCAYWTWRAYPDQEGSEGAFQNPPFTCLVYGDDYINGVLSTDMPTSDAFAVATPYCNFPEIPECMVDIFGREAVRFLEPYSCLLCGCSGKCAWKSPYHLSGPAFCEPEYRDECAYSRPAWTSTLPPCESEPAGTVTETTTMIELDSTLELTGSVSGTTIELEESTNADQSTTLELEQSDVTFPETIGTSMSVETSAEVVSGATSEGSTDASEVVSTTPVTMGTSMTAQSSMDVSGETKFSTALGSGLTQLTGTPAASGLGSSQTEVTITPVGTIGGSDLSQEQTSTAAPSQDIGTASGSEFQTSGTMTTTWLHGDPCPECPDNCEDEEEDCIDC